MIDLDAIKARCDKATPGPWESNISSIDQACKPWGEVVALEERGSAFMRYQALVMSKDDADFIAHARTDVPALVSEVERLRQAISGIWQYGADTMSGPVDGADNRDYYRLGVLEMTARARIALADCEAAKEDGCH